jgi:drug/metabolite transporter (DMT)-like permease
MSDNEPQTEKQDGIIDPVLLSIAIIWGANFPVYKRLLDDIPPVGLLAVRFIVTTSILLVILWASGRLRRNPRAMWLPMFLAGVLVMGAQQMTFVLGLDRTASGEGALLFSTAPIFVALIVAITGSELISRANWLGVFAAFAGVALVIMGGSGAVDAPETGRHCLDGLVGAADALVVVFRLAHHAVGGVWFHGVVLAHLPHESGACSGVSVYCAGGGDDHGGGMVGRASDAVADGRRGGGAVGLGAGPEAHGRSLCGLM